MWDRWTIKTYKYKCGIVACGNFGPFKLANTCVGPEKWELWTIKTYKYMCGTQ
jgi:hypothetical protein